MRSRDIGEQVEVAKLKSSIVPLLKVSINEDILFPVDQEKLLEVFEEETKPSLPELDKPDCTPPTKENLSSPHLHLCVEDTLLPVALSPEEPISLLEASPIFVDVQMQTDEGNPQVLMICSAIDVTIQTVTDSPPLSVVDDFYSLPSEDPSSTITEAYKKIAKEKERKRKRNKAAAGRRLAKRAASRVASIDPSPLVETLHVIEEVF